MNDYPVLLNELTILQLLRIFTMIFTLYKAEKPLEVEADKERDTTQSKVIMSSSCKGPSEVKAREKIIKGTGNPYPKTEIWDKLLRLSMDQEGL